MNLKNPANLSKSRLAIFILAFAIIGYLVFKSFAASNPNLPGDLNNDNTVNAQDLSLLLSNYGTTNPAGDVNSDGTVNAIDLSILLSHYGSSISVSSWVPAPPSSYKTSGTVTSTLLDAQTGDGPGLGQGTFHTTWQHATETPSGDIFVVYNYYDSNDHTVTHFRVKWLSPSPGSAFVTIYDSANQSSDPDYGIVPAIESDANGNVYVIANHSPRGGSSSQTKVTYVHKFAPPYSQAYTHANTVIATIPNASGKFSTLFDQTRQWIWVCFWEDSTNFWATDTSGAIKVQKQIFNTRSATDTPANTGPEKYAAATYPSIAITKDGTLIVAWAAESSEKLSTPTLSNQSYYDTRWMYSPDGGTTFYGPNGAISLPVYADDSGPTSKTAFQVAHPGVDFLSGLSTNYGTGTGQSYNWNHLDSIAFNNNAVNVSYQSASSSSQVFGGEHHPYVRFDWGTKQVTNRREPDFNSENGDYSSSGFHTGPGNTGSFAQDTSESSRLYFVTQGRADQGNLGKIAVLRSDNTGNASPQWYIYALQSSSIGTSNGLINISASRWVQSDGSIIGIVQQADAPYNIYFFKITPS